MKRLAHEDLSLIERWLIAKGRDLEVALFDYLFNGGDQELVLHALSIYQNSDGGFGNGLEPDCLNPNSSSFQTSVALEIMYLAGFNEESKSKLFKKLITPTFKYLYTKVVLIDNKWPITIETNNNYPCAIWWKHRQNASLEYNPTAIILGYTIYFLNEKNEYYQKALKMIDEAFDYYLNSELNDKHEILAFITLIRCLKAKEVKCINIEQVEAKINIDALKIIEKDVSKWDGYYPTLPLDIYYQPFSYNNEVEALIEQNLDYLIDNRNESGMWEINWTWGNDDEAFELAKVKWQGILAYRNLLILQAFDRIKG